jgi:hypothetical protein
MAKDANIKAPQAQAAAKGKENVTEPSLKKAETVKASRDARSKDVDQVKH